LPRIRPSDEATSDSELDELAAFGAALEELRRQSRLSYRSLSTKAGCSSSALAKAASGRERPTLDVVRAFVTACEGDLPDWIVRWHRMSAAVDRHQRDLQAMVDTPYEIMTCPGSPARFNRRLQLRVCRAGKQAGVALRANYAPSTASGVFNGTRLASEEFVRRMLAAAGASDEEQAAWLEWRNQLARGPRPTASSVERVARAQRSRRRLLPFAVAALGLTGAAVMLALSFSRPGKIRTSPPPTTEALSGGFAYRAPNVGTTATAGVRKWRATIVGGHGPVNVVCFTTQTQPIGWYYTDQGVYLDPAIVQFTGDDRNAVPACNTVAFPKAEMAPMPNDPA